MSLTQTAYTSRRVIKFGSLGLVIFSLLWVITTTSIRIYIKSHPKHIEPTLRYGILPKLIFPEKKTESKTFSFELPNDAIPKFNDQTKVYVIYRPNTTFLALAEDTKTAISFGFTEAPIEIKPGIYEFKNNTVLNKNLTVNVLDGDFHITYPYRSDQMLLNSEKMPTKTEAISIASNFLGRGNKLITDLKNGDKQVSFWKIEDGGLKSSTQTESNVARVDFFRENLDELNLISSNFGQASVSVLVSGSTVEEKKIIEVNFKDINIDRESYSTYPIKTAQEAIDNLKAGNYWTAIDVNDKNIIIREMYLAYFEPTTLTNYLQPIYVFKGDNNFVAYIPAIKSEYIVN